MSPHLLPLIRQYLSRSVTHEPSYLPFLFPSLRAENSSEDEAEPVASTSARVIGRRTFKKGREVNTPVSVVFQ